jgi:hypothetical protein
LQVVAKAELFQLMAAWLAFFPLQTGTICSRIGGTTLCVSSLFEGERVMANRSSRGDQKMSPKEEREFNRWLETNAILGSILAIGMLAMALAGSNSAGRSDAAMAASPNVATSK